MIRFKDLIIEALPDPASAFLTIKKPRKGDKIVNVLGEKGIIHSVSKGVVYVKFAHTPSKTFEPIHIQDLKQIGYRGWKEVEPGSDK